MILAGEHAVVFGEPALVATLARGVTVEVVPAATWRLVAVQKGLDRPLAGEATVLPDAALRLLARMAGRDAAVAFLVEGELPEAQGLGSSAALCVAVARALLAAGGASPSPDPLAVRRLADAGEGLFHGRASGADVAAATAEPGSCLLYRREPGNSAAGEVEPVPARGVVDLVVVCSGVPRRTAGMVARVAERRRANPAATDRLLRRIGAVSREAAGALAAGDAETLAAALEENQRLLRDLGVSTDALDALCQAARSAGALGAKLTGGGGGGAVVAVCRPGEGAGVARRLRLAFPGLAILETQLSGPSGA